MKWSSRRVRTRDSALEVRFGLKVQVRALTSVDALLNGIALRAGTMLNATLEDRIIFHNEAELTPHGTAPQGARARRPLPAEKLQECVPRLEQPGTAR